MLNHFKIYRRQWLSFLISLLYLILTLKFMWQYDFSQGLYFEFSILAFLGLAIAGWFNSFNLALASFAFAAPQIVFWLIDAVWLCFSSSSPLGFLETRFHPALPQLDFLAYQYPLLFLPLAVGLIKVLGKKQSPPYLITGLFSIAGLLLSRWVFRGDNDVNCSVLACLPFFYNISAVYYPWIFMGFYVVISLGIAKLLTWYFSCESQTSIASQNPRSFLFIYLLFAFTLFLNLTYRYSHTPHFFCQSSQSSPKGVELNCKYALDVTGSHFSQYFSLRNRSELPQACNLYMTYKEKKDLMYSAVLIKAKGQMTLSVTVPNPTDPMGSTVTLLPECEPLSFN